MKPILEMKNISKYFFTVKALSDADICLYPGECHALLGENGAGKSTLIKILAGIYRADSGEILIDGVPVQIESVPQAMKAGISVIHQELCLAGNMTVAQNIFMGREYTVGALQVLDNKTMVRMAQQILDQNGLDIDANHPVNSLTVAQQQMVEVAKALSQEARIIVMDEPTASLSGKEVNGLFDAIRRLKAKGVAVIYISHRLEELYEVCDNITIMRDGCCVATRPMAEVNRKELVSLMVGRELKDFFDKPDVNPGEALLEVTGMSWGNKVKDASFTLYKGEILGFYGLVGAGRTELMQLIFGVTRPVQGMISLNGAPVQIHKTQDAIDQGIALVPESRKEHGGIMIQSVGFNMVLSILEKLYARITKDTKLQKQIETDYISRMRIKLSSAGQRMGSLSGGNQQKVILAKWLATNPQILILDEPTRGIDVGAKKEIYSIMSELVQKGVSIIMISSDLPEILGMSSRIVTMHEGKITGTRKNDDLTQEEVLMMATGGE